MKLRMISLISVLMTTTWAQAGLYDLNTSSDDKNCSTVSAGGNGEPGLKIRRCQQDIEQKNPGFFIIKSEFRDLPEYVQEHFNEQKKDIKSWEKVYLSVYTENDDVALLGICKMRDTSCSDDTGYSIGVSLALGGNYKGKYDVQLRVANALYSQGVTDTYRVDSEAKKRFETQSIRSVLMMELLVNSVKQDNVLYWSAGTGLIGLSSTEKFGILDAAKQQRSMHSILNSISRDAAVIRTNVDDGASDTWGFYLMAGLGMQKILNVGTDGMRSRNYAQVTTRLSTLSKHSEVRFETGTELSRPLFSSNHRGAVGASVASTIHSAGVLNEGTVYIKFESGKSWESLLGITCQRGKLANFASYNTPNVVTGKPDCMYRMGLKYYVE